MFTKYHNNSSTRPTNVGILGIEVYFPATVVCQKELEKHDNVGTGKYTIGLGQQHMSFCGDREDVISMALTSVSRLLKNYNVPHSQIGRLEVGTETILDKSKSIKTYLMQLFHESGNHNIEGIDTYNACYGGTSALFNTIAWIESSSWDNRLGIVVCGDIAAYASGPARPTGGAGSVALLIGPNAPLVIEPGLRGSYFDHVYDFYKPNLSSDYPFVDGRLSLICYITALHNCFLNYKKVFEKRMQKSVMVDKSCSSADTEVEPISYFCFHSPYTKLVRKSFSRLFYHEHAIAKTPDMDNFVEKGLLDNIENRDSETYFMEKSKNLYDEKVGPSLLLAKNVGNTYTASLYFGLASLIANKGGKDLEGKRVLMFSYGSGLASTMFSLCFTKPDASIYSKLSNLEQRLEARAWRVPSEYVSAMELRENTHLLAPYTPVSNIDEIQEGTYHLTSLDEKYRRYYAYK